TRDRLGIQQFTLHIRMTLHTRIINDNTRPHPTATPIYSADSYRVWKPSLQLLAVTGVTDVAFSA
ncbi:hypothetical protein, partial [Mycobacterium szulgai]|uniref:hypothetical protein n=1 Tax=Mycobacterium szulgai TaxID=1787 RepID=UPI0021F310C3